MRYPIDNDTLDILDNGPAMVGEVADRLNVKHGFHDAYEADIAAYDSLKRLEAEGAVHLWNGAWCQTMACSFLRRMLAGGHSKYGIANND